MTGVGQSTPLPHRGGMSPLRSAVRSLARTEPSTLPTEEHDHSHSRAKMDCAYTPAPASAAQSDSDRPKGDAWRCVLRRGGLVGGDVTRFFDWSQDQSSVMIPDPAPLFLLPTATLRINDSWQRSLDELLRINAQASREVLQPYQAWLQNEAWLQRMTESFIGNWSLPPLDDRLAIISLPVASAEHELAAERIADTPRFKRPLPIKRWMTYRERITAACQERATNDAIHTDGPWWTVLRRVTVEAIRLTAIEVNAPRPSIMVTVDGKRWTVREDRDITPWEVVGELPVSFFFTWFRTNVANEVMDNLLPNWRSEEQRRREKVQFTSLDTLISRVTRQLSEGRKNEKPTGGYDALIAQDATTKRGRDAIIAQDRADSLLDRLSPRLTPSECLALKEYGNGSPTLESVAQSLGKDRSTVSRQIKSIAEKAQRLRDADLSA